MGVAIEGEVFRLAGDVNNDGVIDGFVLTNPDSGETYTAATYSYTY